MSRGALPYPSRAARASPDKEDANRHVLDVFEAQGLGLERNSATVLILDTPDLRTVKMLLRRFSRNIRQIVVVEQKVGVANTIRSAVRRAGLDSIVSVVNDEVVHYVATYGGKARIQYLWLDCMTIDPDRHATLLPALIKAGARALALTLSKRVPGGYAKKAAAIVKRYYAALPYKVLDWGYQVSRKNQHMQVLALGMIETQCVFRTRSASPVPGSPGKTRVERYGYPRTFTIVTGGPESW